jgi:AbrB family looped-hinge helix DNA binding protein
MSEEKKLLGSSKISSQNQITLPKEVRDFIAVEAGDIVGFYLKDDKVFISKS